MRVVGVDTFGGPEALRVFEVPEPHAGAGQIRIRVHAATVNPTDTFTRNGARAAMLKDFAPPYVSGMDAAGVVDQIGEGSTTDLKVGDSVMAIVIPQGGHGAYSEYIVIPAESAVHIPTGASFAAASTLPMNGLTARLSIDQLALKPGQTLAVTGAAGAYGGYVVQLAKADGLRVIADASTADHDLVKSLGADVVVLRGDDVAARILEIMPEGVDAIADGSVQNELLLPALRDGGGFVSVRGFPGTEQRGIQFHTTWVWEYAKATAKLEELRALANSGAVTLRVAQTFPAANASEAHRILEAGGTRGRLVLEF
jgi:NADPH:quinone reductase